MSNKQKHIQRSLILFLFISLQFPVSGQAGKYIREFINDTAFRHAGISMCFRDAYTGEEIASYNEHMALGSASLMKLVTTAAALDILGPEFRFSTRIGYAGSFNAADSSLKGYLVIKGGADPTILSEYFPDHQNNIIETWAEELYDEGIRNVSGSVVSDALIFDHHTAPGGWNWSDLGNYYGAGAHGVCIFDNMYRIHFRSGPEGTKPELVSTEPEIEGLIIENRLMSFGKKDNAYVYLEPFGNHAVIRGEIPVNRNDFILKASIPDPPLLTSALLQKALTERGVSFGKRPTSLRLSPSVAAEYRSSPKTVCFTSYSPVLAEIIKVTNTESVNVYAEQILKYLGALYTKQESASTESGLEAVRKHLETWPFHSKGLYMSDGSGLSRSNALSAHFITSLLYTMRSKSSYGHYFYNSLPEAGKTGTLQNYFRDDVFVDNLRAKSGTAGGMRNYAGYFKTSEGRDIAFAVLVNNFDCTSSEVTGKVESLLKSMFEAV